jgi:hypothetical protein
MSEVTPLKSADEAAREANEAYMRSLKEAAEAQPAAQSKGLFAEVNDLRKVDRAAPVDENAKYSDTFFGHLAANKKFEGLTFVFIGVNSLYIGIDADYSARTGKPADLYDPNTPIGFKIMENIFCTYFTGELVIRFIGYKFKSSSLTDGWFIFDGILVLFMVLETWIFPIFGLGGQLAQFSVLRLLRLLRISRMARLMKKVPELMIIIKGLIASFRSVGCTAILQVAILYVWSILFVSEYHEKEDDSDGDVQDNFGTMGKSMFSLFIYGTVLDDVTACTDSIRATDNKFMLSLFIVFILISSFTILNMLIGILCEVVSATADSEKTKACESTAKEAITTLFDQMDADHSGNITEEEFMNMRDDPAVREALEDMDIYESHFHRYGEVLFHQGADSKAITIDFDTLITAILRLSPGNHINALDFSLLQASIDRTQESLRERILKVRDLIKDKSQETVQAVKVPTNGQENAAIAGTRNTAMGDSPPAPPSAIGMNGGSPKFAASGDPAIQKQYTLDMFQRTSNHQIIEELERRLGVSALESRTLSLSPGLSAKDTQADQAFHSLGVPQE